MRSRGGMDSLRRSRRRGGGALAGALVAAFVSAAAGLAGAATARHVSLNHFQVEFPDGWVRVPDDAAKEYVATVQRVTGSAPSYEVFYERADAAEHFLYPYVMVGYHAGDTRMHRDFSAQLEQDLEKAADKVSSRTEGFLDGIEFGRPVLEAQMSRCWVKLEMNVAGVAVTGLTLLKLGEKGVAAVSCYARADEFDSYELEFRMIAESVRFEPGWRHDPAKGPSFFSTLWGRVALFAAFGALVGLISSLARARARASRPGSGGGPYAPVPYGAPLSRSLMDPDSIRRQPAAAHVPPPPAAAVAVPVPLPSRRSLPSEEGPLVDRVLGRPAPSPPPPPPEESPLIDPSLLRPKKPEPPMVDRWRPPPRE